MKYLLLLLLLTGCEHQTHEQPVVLHMVIEYTPDKQIDRIFPTEEKAKEYIDTYKNSHDYFYEAKVLGPDGI